MQSLLASLVVGMSVKDEAFRAGMATARAEAKKTGQDFEREGARMSGAIERAAETVNNAAAQIMDSCAAIGREVRNAGLTLTATLTVPLAALAHTAKESASDFQAAMNRVHSAMVDASPEQLEKLRDAAMRLGPEMGRSSIEAAEAIEMLAKNGLDATSILNGGLAASLRLAVVGQTSLSNAADLTTDLLTQFGKTTADLPMIVDRVSGALDKSKMGFDDYRLAAGQAGGLVGALGYSFEDFNTALAATAPLFDSGADAGTSFRTFLTSLNAKSEDAERTMRKLGMSFYNADGSARPLAEIADQLQKSMGKLSDRSKGVALENMFGVDGARTALALITLGFKGVEDARKGIASVTADQKLAILLDGEAAAAQRLGAAWEKLKIRIGEAGIIQIATAFKSGLASMVELAASARPVIFYLGNAFGALTASLGPLMIVLPAMLPVLAALALRGTLVARGFGFLATSIAAVLNPTAFLLRALGGLLVARLAGTAIGALGATMVRLAGPIGILVGLLTFIVPLLRRAGTASDTMRKAVDAAREAEQRATEVTMQLATATGKAREEILKKAQADRIAARDAVAKAKADVIAARAAYAAAQANSAKASSLGSSIGDSDGGINVGAGAAAATEVKRRADLLAGVEALDARVRALDTLNDSIAGANAPTDPKIDMSFDKADKDRKKKDRTAQNAAAFEDELGQSRVALLQARADLTGSSQARYRADMAAIAEERASYIRRNAIDEGLTDARRAQLLAAKDAELAERRMIVERDLNITQAQEAYDLARAENEAAQDRVRGEIDFADSVAARRDAELRLLALQRQQEEADLDLIMATKATASVEWANASKRKDDLDRIYADRTAAIERQNEGPGASYQRWLARSTAAIGEDLQGAGVSALKDLNSELADALTGTGKLGDAFANMGRRIITSLIEIGLQQRLIAPLARSLFGASDGGGGGGLLGSLAKFVGLGTSAMAGSSLLTQGAAAGANLGSAVGAPIALPDFGGFRKDGGGINPHDWYVVGEEGPEVFAPGVSGTVIPNGGIGNGSRQRPVVQLAVEEGSLFRPTVRGISGDVAVETVGASNRAQARAQRRRLR